jgi:hypothetical protein
MASRPGHNAGASAPGLNSGRCGPVERVGYLPRTTPSASDSLTSPSSTVSRSPTSPPARCGTATAPLDVSIRAFLGCDRRKRQPAVRVTEGATRIPALRHVVRIAPDRRATIPEHSVVAIFPHVSPLPGRRRAACPTATSPGKMQCLPRAQSDTETPKRPDRAMGKE